MINKKLLVISSVTFVSVLASCHGNANTGKSNDTDRKHENVSRPVVHVDVSKTIGHNIEEDTSFSMLLAALKASDLFAVTTKPGPFTIFAPDNSAFRNLPDGTLEGLMNDRKNDLANILSHHIVAGLVQEKDLREIQKLKTLAGDELIVTIRNEDIIVNGVPIDAHGLRASNGIIFTTHSLFFPKNQNAGAY